jgi:hypothetical protein
MYSKFLLLSLLFFTLYNRSHSNEDCDKKTRGGKKYACGSGCTGTPSCGGRECGNVDNMCYCFCYKDDSFCLTSDLGYKWNNGIRKKDGSYALNGSLGDGKNYVC